MGFRLGRFAVPQSSHILPADSMALASFNPSLPVCRDRVVSVQRQDELAACVFANQTKLLLSRSLAKSVAVGDEITFPIPAPDAVGPEILVTKSAASGASRYIYQAPIGYVSQPKPDKRNQHYVSAEVQRGSLGMGTVFLPCELLRDYFYRLPQTAEFCWHAGFIRWMHRTHTDVEASRNRCIAHTIEAINVARPLIGNRST